MKPSWIILVLAIFAETVGTTALQTSQQFTRLFPSLVAVLGYGASFYLLAVALKSIPIGIAYAIWSGLGIVFIALIGRLIFGQRLDMPAYLGIATILAGILVIQLFSKAGH